MSTGGPNGDRLSPGTVLGRYVLGRQLGRGGMGAVYEAVHRDLRKNVAVKVLSGALATNDLARQRFLREGEAASRIRHPHVVDVTDVGTEGDNTYLVMELLEGEDLASRIQRGPVEAQEAVDLLLPVLAGVHAAHQEGIVHRDLKPENIFLARQRQGGIVPKVLDFGVSKLATDGQAMALTGTAAVFGTPYYMPPEQVRGAKQADQKSDQYSLGVVLYEALTGRRPYDGDNIYAVLHALAAGQFTPPRALRPQIPEGLEAAVLRAMSLEPARRFPSLPAFGVALLPFAGETTRMLWSGTLRTALGPAAGAAVSDAPSEPPTTAPPVGARPGPISGARRFDTPAARAPTTLGTATGQMVTDQVGRRKTARSVVIVAAAAAAGGGAFLLAPRLGKRAESTPSPAAVVSAPAPPAEPATFTADVTATPATASFELDGAAVATGHLRRVLRRDGAEHRLVVRAPGYRDTEVLFADHPPPPRLTLAPEPSPPPVESAAHAPAAREERHHRRSTAPTPPAGPETHERAVPRTVNGAPLIE